VKHASGEIIALIDSDNILPERDWFARMAAPFDDPEIAGTEPLYYTYRKEDGYITRYCAMLGMNLISVGFSKFDWDRSTEHLRLREPYIN